jgi:hypothetical protein
LDGFEHDDGEAAYALAAPAIKEMFSDADDFMAMVRHHDAPVYRHRSVEFGTLRVSRAHLAREALQSRHEGRTLGLSGSGGQDRGAGVKAPRGARRGVKPPCAGAYKREFSGRRYGAGGDRVEGVKGADFAPARRRPCPDTGRAYGAKFATPGPATPRDRRGLMVRKGEGRYHPLLSEAASATGGFGLSGRPEDLGAEVSAIGAITDSLDQLGRWKSVGSDRLD